MSDPTNDASGEPAEKRVRKTRVAKPKDALTVPPLEDAKPAPPPRVEPASPATPAPAAPVSQSPAPALSTAVAESSPASTGNEGGGNDAGSHDGGSEPRDGQPRHNNNRRERFKNRRDRQRERYRDGGMPDDGGGNGEGFVPRPHPQVPEGFPTYSLGDLKRMPAARLLDIAEQLQISEGVARARKQDIIFAILKVLTRHGEGVQADGVLEILPDGFGFLRAAEASYLAGPDDTYISPS